MNKSLFTFLSVALIMLIPVPGRLAYGIIMVLEFMFLMASCILVKGLIVKIKMEEFQNFLMPIIILALSIIFKQILVMVSPVMAFTLGYIIYLPAVSTFILETAMDEIQGTIFIELKHKMRTTLLISLPILIVFLFRDIVGFGTFTLPEHNGLLTLRIIPEMEKIHLPTVFFASIPGAFLLIALCIIIVNRIGLKFAIEFTKNDMPDTEETQPAVDDDVQINQEGLSSFTNPFDQPNSGEQSFGGLNMDGPSLLNLQGLMGETNDN